MNKAPSLMKILIADDESNARYGMAKALRADGREILEATNGKEAIACIQDQLPDLVFLDLNMPEKSGIEVLSELQQHSQARLTEIIVVTANDSLGQAVECIRLGASDFVAKPFEVEQIRAIARRSQRRVELQQEASRLQSQLTNEQGFGELFGVSRPMLAIFDQIARAARSDLPVLIRGESGTGKELVARELHKRSIRASGPFVAINTAAIAENLVESELFGHVKGAFTGADRDREGVFRQANGGTLFLDEIGDMPTSIQTRLLRVLQENLLQPVGSEKSIAINVRLVSATHQDLELAIEEKHFRQDLYYRLRGIELSLPPLRNRPEDILLLSQKYAPEKQLSSETVSSMLQYKWPGNVRELKQKLQAAQVMTDDLILEPRHLGLGQTTRERESHGLERYFDLPLTEAKERLVEAFERLAIERALHLENGNVSAAARRLGIHRQSLQQKMKQLG